MIGMCEHNWQAAQTRERSQSYDVSKRQAGNGHMINAASPDLSSKTCGSVRAHATDRRWKTRFDFHRRPGVGVGATGATGAHQLGHFQMT